VLAFEEFLQSAAAKRHCGTGSRAKPTTTEDLATCHFSELYQNTNRHVFRKPGTFQGVSMGKDRA